MRAIFKIDIRELYAGQFRDDGASSSPIQNEGDCMSVHEPASRFCPACGGPLETRQLKAGDPPRLVCAQCGFILYLDPKVAVGTVITTADDRIVLVRRAIEPGYGLWVFPGGYVDRGEEITTAARREAREEAGLEIRLDGLINIYSYPGRPIVIVVYRAADRRWRTDRLTTSRWKRGCLRALKSRGPSSPFEAHERRSRTTSPGRFTPSGDSGIRDPPSEFEARGRAHLQKQA